MQLSYSINHVHPFSWRFHRTRHSNSKYQNQALQNFGTSYSILNAVSFVFVSIPSLSQSIIGSTTLMIPKMKEGPLERSCFSWLDILVLHSYQYLLEFFQTTYFQKYPSVLNFLNLSNL
ncbi:hypothetical protein ACB098_11G152800 [Castanea mollissima]